MSITRIQGQATNPTGLSTSFTAGLSSGVQRGNLLVASVAVGNNATTITGPSGWTAGPLNQPNGSNATIETSLFYFVVGAGQVGQTSWTWTLSASHTCYINIEEWHSSNGWPSNPLDVTAQGDTAGSPTQSITIVSGTTGTTAQASELLVASLAYKGSAQSESNVTTGWTSDLESTLANNNTMTMLYNVVNATGTAACQYTITSAEYWAGVVATFKDNPAGTTPQLGTSPISMTFSATTGGSSPSTQNDTLSETAGAATAWTSSITYGSGSGWLGISPTSGNLSANGNTSITVTATLGSLTAGTYTATVTFTATTGGSTATIAVTFVVGNPVLSTSPNSMTFSATIGGSNPATQNDTLSETAGGPTAWTATISYTGGPRSGWLSTSPSSGSLLANGNATITVSPSVVSLPIGTYTATVTFTATTGGSTATIAVTFTVSYAATFSVLLAGQNITNYVDQMSIDAIDALGQGSGAGGAPTFQGRQSTIKFDTSLGPMNGAYGAGQTLPSSGGPFLVRQGKLIMTDATGNTIWAGYATKYTDITTATIGHTLQPFTTIEGVDYDAALDRVLVNQSYAGFTDVQIIKAVITQYTPWIGLSLMPAIGTFLFPVKNFRNVSVQKVLRTIAGITGYMVWVDFNENLHYVPVSGAQSAPFGLSDSPDFIVSFPHNVQEFYTDDNSVINRVTFYGGRHNSGDFTQDVSPLANGSNKVFPLAYYPHPTSDGLYHVTVNGVQQVVGDVNGAQTPANTFVSAGGLANVLMNSDAHAITFDVAPASGATVLVKYQYDFPLTIVIPSTASLSYFGPPYLDGYISDDTVFDIPTAVQRAKVVLAQQAFGLVTLKVDCWQPGLRSGMTVNVKNTVRGINAAYLVQQVEMEPLGAGNFVYHLTLGGWEWNLIDVTMQLANAVVPADTSQSEAVSQEDVNIVTSNLVVTTTWAKSDTAHAQPYYARSAVVGDGHDAYPGFATISS